MSIDWYCIVEARGTGTLISTTPSPLNPERKRAHLSRWLATTGSANGDGDPGHAEPGGMVDAALPGIPVLSGRMEDVSLRAPVLHFRKPRVEFKVVRVIEATGRISIVGGQRVSNKSKRRPYCGRQGSNRPFIAERVGNRWFRGYV